MKLANWRRAEGVTQQHVAIAIGSSVPTVARYEAGLRLPERDAMKAIYVLTRGAVKPNDFYDLPAWEAEMIAAEGDAELARAAA